MFDNVHQSPTHVIVTGAGSGIGAATALAFATMGSHVVCADIDAVGAKTTAEACRALSSESAAIELDVADSEAVEDAAHELQRHGWNFDVAVNNAGVGMTGHFADMDREDWEWIRSINLDGVINGCRSFGRPMIERGSGHVVNMSSGLAYTIRATEPAYITTKAAVLAFSRSLRSDWSRHNVGVTAICPGVINTAIIDSTRHLGSRASEPSRDKIKNAFARGHNPEIVANAVVKAVKKNPAVVPVGWESTLGWYANRFLPTRLETYLGRWEIL